MKRWMIYAIGAAVVLALGGHSQKDVSGLLPVELLYISRESGMIRAETDAGDLGWGKDLEEALADLKETAPGEIFLETANYLVVTQRTVNLLPELTELLRPGAEVCLGIDMDVGAVEYLKAHPSEMTLKDVRAGAREIPVLIRKGERYQFGGNRKIFKEA